MRNQKADQGRNPDRRKTDRRIAADDQFEAVERAGERRTERAGDAGGGAAADQDTQVAASQAKCIADARGDARRHLRVAGFEADRCPDAARPDGLQGDYQAAHERHAAAMQRIGFDRVDFAIRPPSPDQLGGNAKQDAAADRHQYRKPRIEREPPRQPLARRQLEKNLMQEIDGIAHQGDDHAGDGAHQRRQADETRTHGRGPGRVAAAESQVGLQLQQSRRITRWNRASLDLLVCRTPGRSRLCRTPFAEFLRQAPR